MYEIPQQLEYKEKIIFGLTFGQIMWAGVFFPFAFICFFRIKAELPVRVILTFIPVSLASGFMFFNFSTQIKNWVRWYKQRRITTKKQIEKLFGIKKITEDLIIR